LNEDSPGTARELLTVAVTITDGFSMPTP